MLHLLERLQKRWDFQLEVVYVHHGKTENAALRKFRDKAEKRVAELADRLHLSFASLDFATSPNSKSDAVNKESEEVLRNGRYRALEKYAVKANANVIALGHHKDDLFETRLIRLIRGTGPQGISAMQKVATSVEGTLLWRPLLDFSRSEIESYLTSLGLKKNSDWLNDPSNRDARYLRNSIRKKLIPAIEQIRPGGVAAFSRSLALLAEFVENSESKPITSGELSRRELMALVPSERREILMKWVRTLGIRDFSNSHVLEMLKRIDTPQRRLSFELCGRSWAVDESIRLLPGKN
jgi:tRNA(Ile)-lysidine synthase